jgi:uncharacterized protein
MTTRRGFLASILAASALPSLSWADAGSPAYLSAAKLPDGSFAIYGLSRDGVQIFSIPLPARGHAATAHPTRPEAVAFARRPGTFAVVLDCVSGEEIARLAPPIDSQFNGHGTFSQDGSVLYTSEVIAETSEGRIGLWDTAGAYRRIGSWPSGGIGPHDLKRLPGSDILVAANGGIKTDPQDRTKLNIDSMRPNLTYLSGSGDVLNQIELAAEFRQNSIRHLAIAADGTVAFALQWEGDSAEPAPLLGLHKQGGVPYLCNMPEAEMFVMQGYAGSIAFDAAGETVAITSSHGGAVQIYRRDGSFLAGLSRPDASGIAAGQTGFVLTDGFGNISKLIDQTLTPLAKGNALWDNHLVALNG